MGSFLALWVIGYGFVQASAPELMRRSHHGQGPGGGTARLWAFVLALFPAGIAIGLDQGWDPNGVLVVGLILFGVVFAINSAVHSYLILAYSDFDKVSMNVGFYYMANAGGRLVGTVLSGWVYQHHGPGRAVCGGPPPSCWPRGCCPASCRRCRARGRRRRCERAWTKARRWISL